MVICEKPIPPDLPPLDIPAAVEILRAAEAEIERFQMEDGESGVPGFVPGDYAGAAAILGWLTSGLVPPGSTFCEWGSGLGVVTMLADAVGWQAIGIEIEPVLVQRACRLARRLDRPVEFVQGSFLPPGCETWLDGLDEFDEPSWLFREADDTYRQLGMDIDDFGLIYVYPWPGERALMLEIFERYGRPGGWLLSYHGAAEWHLWEKQSE